MSAQEERQQIIKENIPKLVEALTKFERDEENFKRCEQFAWYTIKNHKNLSVNSHEIKRKIDGMMEKFIVGNYQQYADHLKNLYNDLINHPLCLNHYEVDVQWAILEFLLNLCYNPVGSLRRNKLRIPAHPTDFSDVTSENDLEHWTKVLQEDCIPRDDERYRDDSELSDWSDSENEASNSYEDLEHIQKPLEKSVKTLSGINPPKKDDNFKIFDGSKSKQWLLDNVQNSWWLQKYSNCKVGSSHDGAHFCHFWNEYLAEKSNNLIKLKQISTASEYCLLREIIWMFQCPTNGKFFVVDHNEIFVRDNVSIPSVTMEGFRFWLQSLIPYIKMASSMQNFINSVYYYDERAPPRVYEYYAPSLKGLLQIFYDKLINIEEEIQKQSAFQINTLIHFQQDMSKSFRFLEKLYNIHSFVVLDYKSTPAHICSAHLLAGLLCKFNLAYCPTTPNLAASLFLSTVQVFCNIIDNWWTEGRLDDWRNEFLVEKISDESEEICPRPYAKSREKAFFVAADISSVIQRDGFLKLLMDHSLEAGCTLNLLYQINKIGDLKNASNFEKSLYDNFLEEVLSRIEQFQDNELVQSEEQCEDVINEQNLNLTDNFISNGSLSFDDKFLFMVFSSNLQGNNGDTVDSEVHENKTRSDSQNKKSTLNIFEKLNRTSKIILPLEEIIIECMLQILQTRISFANKFVITMYREEFQILRHLKNIRRVLLLESSDLMYSFYIKLFLQIEAGKTWANPFLLTVQLDDIMCSKFPDISSLFRIEINSNFKSQTVKVTEAVEELVIKYDVKKELQNIITQRSMDEYNKVFRFLLKVKWGLWALENLHFPLGHKKRIPFAAFDITDLLMRRLQQIRFWLLYAIQCVHFHLMTHVLQSMGQQLGKKIQNCENLIEMKSVHESYIKTVCEHCFIGKNGVDIKIGVEQFLNLVYVLRVEWQNYVRGIETGDIDDSDSGGENGPNYVLTSQIEAIENTYIRCHQYMAKVLNNEVYIKQNTYLSGLSAAFNTSMPY